MDANFVENKTSNAFKLIILTTCWNIEKYAERYIKSLINQTHVNFVAYIIDDLSTDNTFQILSDLTCLDKRFFIIKNSEKKYKTKNFIDTIKNNVNINGNDVIVEIDGDDRLSDNDVLQDIYNIYTNNDIWISNSRWLDTNGKNVKNYGKANPENARYGPWNFSHLRTYRVFLFRLIKEEDLKYNGEYFKAACDLAYSIPMLEMAGTKHYYFLDRVTYIYQWHSNQTYSINSPVKNPELQQETARYITSKLKPYKKIYLKFDLATSPSNATTNRYAFVSVREYNTNKLIDTIKII
jgi:glycosyltransferase involved in cell wall biosynthesis